MEEKHHTTEVVTETNSLPIEEELISLIKKAREMGFTQSQTTKALQKCWEENPINLPEESESEKCFRIEAKKFMDNIYQQFNLWAKHKSFTGWYWSKTDELNDDIKKSFLLEVLCTIYKGFQMNTFDRNAMKKINVERTKIMFPMLKRNHCTYYNMFVDSLLRFVTSEYEIEDVKKQKLEAFLDSFELSGKDDRAVATLIWLVENFD